MACSSCKNKGSNLKDKMDESTKFVSRWTIWVFVVWSVLGLYGLYSLIHKFI
jgi:hypothetical protein